jgi:hypothetical protein
MQFRSGARAQMGIIVMAELSIRVLKYSFMLALLYE